MLLRAEHDLDVLSQSQPFHEDMRERSDSHVQWSLFENIGSRSGQLGRPAEGKR